MIAYTLRQLAYFVTAAEHKSLLQAALQLHVSPPSVSTAIAKLEGQFGVQLLIRHHAQGVSLTPSGQRLLPQAQSLLRHAEELQQSAVATGNTVSGELNVGCFVTIAALFMPSLISGFTRIHPAATIRLYEGNQAEIIEALKRGRLELALVYDRELSGDVHFELLTESAPYVLLPAGHPLAKKKRLALKALRNEPLILLDIPPSREYFLSLFEDDDFEPRIGFSSPSFEVVRGMVGRGAGYSLLVTKPQGDVTYDGCKLVTRPLAGSKEPGRIGLAVVSNLRPTRLMQAFREYCVERLSRPIATQPSPHVDRECDAQWPRA